MIKYEQISCRFERCGRTEAANAFSGFIEVEDEIYKTHGTEYGDVGHQYFRGIVRDAADGRACPIYGEYFMPENMGTLMRFYKLSSDAKASPASFVHELEAGQNGIVGFGAWSPRFPEDSWTEHTECNIEKLPIERARGCGVVQYLADEFAKADAMLSPAMKEVQANYVWQKVATVMGVDNAPAIFGTRKREPKFEPSQESKIIKFIPEK